MRKQIVTEKGAKPKGPYSQAIVADGLKVYVSGQGSIDPQTGEFRQGSFREQAELVFQNVSTLLEAAGTSWQHVVKVNIYLADLSNFAQLNEIYNRYLTEPYPARTTTQAGLGKNALVVDCIALIPQDDTNTI